MKFHTLSKLCTKPLLAILFCLGIALPAAAFAQDQQTQPDITEEKFGDWDVKCKIIPENNNLEFCDMQQAVQDADGGVIAHAVLGFRDNEKTQLGGLFIIPLNILLPKGTLFQIDGSETQKTGAPVIYCRKIGCYIEAGFPAEWITGMKKGSVLNITYYTIRNEPITAKLSLNGFSAAYNRISK